MNILEVNKVTDFNHLNLFSIKYQDRAGNPKSWIFASRSKIPDVRLKTYNNLHETTINDVIDHNTTEKTIHNNQENNRSISDIDITPGCNIEASSKPHAVVIVPFHLEHQKLVLIKEFRVALGAYQYGFPAGLMDRGEEIEQTAARELKEETGLDIVSIIRRSPVIYSSSGMTDESIALVYVTCSGNPSLQWNEDSEDITVLMLSGEEAQDLIETPHIKFDVKSWIVLSTFAKTGEI